MIIYFQREKTMSQTNRGNIQLPGMPDLEEVKRTLTEVEAGTIPPHQLTVKEHYLLESAIAMQDVLLSVEQLEGLTRGIEQLLKKRQAG
jgi:sulfite reductase beta subunit-like hemoprotein